MTGEPDSFSLRFDDRELERAYAADHALRSVLPVRGMAGVLSIASIGVAAAVLGGSAAAEAGVGAAPDREPLFWTRFAVSLVTIVVLVVGVGHPRVLPRQQPFIAGCLLLLLFADVPTIARFEPAYGLTATLLQMMTAYVLLRLRLGWAMWVAGTATASYLAVAVSGPIWAADPALQVNVGGIFLAHFIFVAANYQVERLDRIAFFRRHQLEHRSRDLERALDELKEAESQLVESERQASVGRLAAGLLHELNNPIGVVRSTSQTLSRLLERVPGAGSDAVLELMAAHREGVERLSSVVTQLERFVAMDHGTEGIVDLREGLRSGLALLGDRLEGVAVAVALPDDPIAVRCNPTRLHHAFHAVLDNAARALDGKGRLTVRAGLEEGRWRIEIEDDGPGVPEATLARLFEPSFGREGARVKMRLGLPTARRAAEACGGHLVHTRPAEGGARFCFELPAA